MVEISQEEFIARRREADAAPNLGTYFSGKSCPIGSRAQFCIITGYTLSQIALDPAKGGAVYHTSTTNSMESVRHHIRPALKANRLCELFERVGNHWSAVRTYDPGEEV